MNGVDAGQLVYLLVLGTAIAFMVLVRGRLRLGQAAQYLAIWALILLGAVAVAGLWSDIRSAMAPRQTVYAEAGRVTLPRAADGHYYARLEVNGTPLRFVVDTGATGIVLTRQDAERIGFDPETLSYFGQAMTANGMVRTAPVRLDTVTLGPFSDSDVPAFVNDGAMEVSLLGMTYLQRFARVEISAGRMLLER